MNAIQTELLAHLDDPEHPHRNIYSLRDNAQNAWARTNKLEAGVFPGSFLRIACVSILLDPTHRCGIDPTDCLLLNASLVDHGSFWCTADSKRPAARVFQPYGNRVGFDVQREAADVIAEAAEACRAHGLTLNYWAPEDPGNPGWHWPGKTAFVRVERAPN